MTYLRLMKYPGSKATLIPDIRKIFEASGRTAFVDVFGGSGVVSLNVGASSKLYNDIDPEMVNVFSAIRDNPALIRRLLSEATRKGKLVDPLKSGNFGDPDVQIRFESEIKAFSTIYRFTVSFGGMGETYNTKEKSTYRYAVRTLEQFREIAHEISSWNIENLDFRELIPRYDSPENFFYLDPPYSGKKWYEHNLGRRDFRDLKEILGSIKGCYLLNLDREDNEAMGILGSPDFIKAYENMNAYPARRPPRLKAFYTNVSLPSTQ